MVKEAAQKLGISVNTVMSYARRIQKREKLLDLHRVYVWCVIRESLRRTIQETSPQKNINTRIQKSPVIKHTHLS